jgi:hypothetical protein
LNIILYKSFRDSGLQNTKCYDGNGQTCSLQWREAGTQN